MGTGTIFFELERHVATSTLHEWRGCEVSDWSNDELDCSWSHSYGQTNIPQVVSLVIRVMTSSMIEILREDRCSWELCYEECDVILIFVIYVKTTGIRCNEDWWFARNFASIKIYACKKLVILIHDLELCCVFQEMFNSRRIMPGESKG